MADWTTFPAWSKFLRGEEGLGNPFHKEPITKKSVFLYSEMAAPLPSGATAGMWFSYPCGDADLEAGKEGGDQEAKEGRSHGRH
jgi:hypothetical protein